MLDLSYLDIRGNIKKEQETANSYVIREPGNYCLPLVYGNSKDQVCEVVSAELVNWDSSRDIIGRISTDGEYLNFIVKVVPDSGANYIVAVKNKDGRILWSWHIWLWKDELIDSDHGLLLDTDLATKKIGKHRVVWFYQWGRKDPLYPNLPKARIWRADSINCIGNPCTYMTSSITPICNWGNEKTVFDPCPPGYKVPNSSIFHIFKKREILIDKRCLRVGNLIFWKTGFRGIGTRKLINGIYMFVPGLVEESTGRYWSSSKEIDLRISTMYETTATYEISSYLNGFAIRPQKIT